MRHIFFYFLSEPKQRDYAPLRKGGFFWQKAATIAVAKSCPISNSHFLLVPLVNYLLSVSSRHLFLELCLLYYLVNETFAVSLSDDVTNLTSTVGASRPVLARTTREWVKDVQ